MKPRVFAIFLTGIVITFSAFALIAAGSGQKAEATSRNIPVSLGNFYPPQSPAPVYLLAMLDMARPFSGMVCDVLENDQSNARANFQSFKELYIKTSNMIPEWKQDYSMQPVDRLEAALSAWDQPGIMQAVDDLGKTCHRCHIAAMAPVQQKYRWPDFKSIRVMDPLSGREVSYAEIMLMMETNFTGIGTDLQQGQKENALAQLAGFKARFAAMAEACMDCHDSDREYYVDKSITDMISALEMELGRENINMKAIGGLFQSIGEESCSRCHLVHIPAAYAQQNIPGSDH